MIRTAIRWCATTLARVGGFGGVTPTQQVTFMEKAANAVPWLPYGFFASVPPDKLGVLLSILGNSDSSVFLPGSPGEDPVAALGEVGIYNPTTGVKVHLLANGTALIQAGAGSLIVSATGVAVTGDLTVSGSITAASATVSGAANLGSLTVTGATALGAAVTSDGINIGSTHLHAAGTLMDSTPAAVTGSTAGPS